MTDLAMRTGLLIRRPVAEVFRLFTDPAETTRIWFTGSTGRLEPGATVTWTFAMYGITVGVEVLDLVPDERIRIRWGTSPDLSEVEWQFEDRGDGTTHVRVTESGFGGDAAQRVNRVIDSTIGFTKVLCAAKAYLEHGVLLNVVVDR